jgi:hypothetical protein
MRCHIQDGGDTHIIHPLDPRLEFSKTEMNLDGEDNSPVFLSVSTILRLCTTIQK